MTGREYLLIVGVLLLIICVCILLLGMGYWARRDLDSRYGLRERPMPEEPCDLGAVIRDHLALADRHAEEIELRRVA